MKLAPFLLILEDYLLPCLTKKIFGFDCPGCGMQRAIILLFKGEIAASFEMYPAIFALAPLLIFLAISRLIKIKYANAIILSLVTVTMIMVFGNFILKFI